MDIDTAQLAQDLLNAFKKVAGAVAPGEAAILQQQAQDLADGIADVAQKRAAGQINDDQAKGLLNSYLENAKADLDAAEGVLQQNANHLIAAGLVVALSAGLTAAGVPWLIPFAKAATDQVLN